MKKIYFVFLAILLAELFLVNFSFGDKPNQEQAKQRTIAYFESELAQLLQAIDELSAKSKQQSNKQALINGFAQVREKYKHCQFFIEFFNPTSAEQVNGALLHTVAFDDPNQVSIPPQGLQVVEELIYADRIDYKAIGEELGNVRGILLRVKQLHAINDYNSKDVFAAAQLELIRVMSLGLAGFDATISKQQLIESAASLSAMQKVFAFYGSDAALNKAFDKNIGYLLSGSNYLDFNYSLFMAQYLQPLYAQIVELRKNLGIEALGNLPLDLNKPSIFNSNAWIASYYAKNKNFSSDKNLVDLGKILFYDPILSGNNKRSCASCHKPDKFFTDGLAKSIAFDFEGTVARNAPSIVNSTLQAALFWDNRVNNTEDQLNAVLNNPKEMHANFEFTLALLNKSNAYQDLFKKAFPQSSVIDKSQLLIALQAFEHSLTAFSSPFDAFMQGNTKAMTAEQQLGFNLFMGKAQCATCHFMPQFNGSVPPLYTEMEWEIIGTPKAKDNKQLDTDQGAYVLYNKDLHRFAFKTPSLRNVALTAPYMHNGVYDTLDEVIDFYNHGGGLGHGYEVPNQTLPADSLGLSSSETKAIKAFMLALSTTKKIDVRVPSTLPRLADEQLNARKPGGEY